MPSEHNNHYNNTQTPESESHIQKPSVRSKYIVQHIGLPAKPKIYIQYSIIDCIFFLIPKEEGTLCVHLRGPCKQPYHTWFYINYARI